MKTLQQLTIVYVLYVCKYTTTSSPISNKQIEECYTYYVGEKVCLELCVCIFIIIIVVCVIYMYCVARLNWDLPHR